MCNCEVETLAIVAAVVGQAGSGREWHRIGADEVAPAQLDRIHSELDRGDVHHAFAERVRLGATGTTVDADRCGVGRYGAHFYVDVRDVVRSGHHQHAGAGRRHRARRRVRAGVGDDAHAHADNRAVGSQAELGVLQLRPPVRHGDEALGSRLVPLQRSAKRAGERRDDEVLGRSLELRAEAATDLWDDDADQLDGKLQCLRELSPYTVHELRRRPQRHAAGRVIRYCERAVGFHRRRRHALVDEVAGDDDIGVRACTSSVGWMRAGSIDVGRHRRMQDERVGGDALSRRNDHGQRFVLDVDEFGRVRGRRHGLGDDDDDGFADETHDIARE